MTMFDTFFFVVFPYLAVAVFLLGAIYRYKALSFKYSSLSSQFLEGRQLFLGAVSFHIGIIVVLFGHLIAFMFPGSILLFNSHPVRLLILETTGFVFALCLLFGLASLFVRRITNPRLRMVTNRMDILIELLLLAQAVLGCTIALGYRWGSSWAASILSPYLLSLLTFDPRIEVVATLPWVIKYHIIGAFLIVILLPFSRLVHLLVAPIHYLWRPYQQVIWNWDRTAIRLATTAWCIRRPRNN